MEIVSLYNVPVKLEKGDLIAVNDEKLYVRSKDEMNKVHVCHVFDLENLEKEILVSTAGFLPTHDYLFKNFEWKKY